MYFSKSSKLTLFSTDYTLPKQVYTKFNVSIMELSPLATFKTIKKFSVSRYSDRLFWIRSQEH